MDSDRTLKDYDYYGKLLVNVQKKASSETEEEKKEYIEKLIKAIEKRREILRQELILERWDGNIVCQQ